MYPFSANIFFLHPQLAKGLHFRVTILIISTPVESLGWFFSLWVGQQENSNIYLDREYWGKGLVASYKIKDPWHLDVDLGSSWSFFLVLCSSAEVSANQISSPKMSHLLFWRTYVAHPCLWSYLLSFWLTDRQLVRDWFGNDIHNPQCTQGRIKSDCSFTLVPSIVLWEFWKTWRFQLFFIVVVLTESKDIPE